MFVQSRFISTLYESLTEMVFTKFPVIKWNWTEISYFYAHEKCHCIVPPMISWKLHLAVNSQACDFEIEYSWKRYI